MKTKQVSNKLVANSNKESTEQKTTAKRIHPVRVSIDKNIKSKFIKKLRKLNKGKPLKNRITQEQAVSEAVKLWMEKNPI